MPNSSGGAAAVALDEYVESVLAGTSLSAEEIRAVASGSESPGSPHRVEAATREALRAGWRLSSGLSEPHHDTEEGPR